LRRKILGGSTKAKEQAKAVNSLVQLNEFLPRRRRISNATAPSFGGVVSALITPPLRRTTPEQTRWVADQAVVDPKTRRLMNVMTRPVRQHHDRGHDPVRSLTRNRWGGR
jgi:hypothetical protein